MAKRKLTDDQVREIREQEALRVYYANLAVKLKREAIAKHYGVSYSVITSIINGDAYADVK